MMTRQRKVRLLKVIGVVICLCLFVLVREWALLKKLSDMVSESDKNVVATLRGQLPTSFNHASEIFGVSSSGLFVQPVLQNEHASSNAESHSGRSVRRSPKLPVTLTLQSDWPHSANGSLMINTAAFTQSNKITPVFPVTGAKPVVLPSALMNLRHLMIADNKLILEALTPRILLPYNAQQRNATNRTTKTRPEILIGIPTVYRVKHEYIDETLNSLFKNLDADEDDVSFIVFIAEIYNLTWADALASRLSQTYADQLTRGILQILSPSPAFYPDFSTLPLTLNDTAERVKWRSKQCLDFAYLMSYAQPQGSYYLQLEDDVITKPNYVTTIRKFIDGQRENNDWFMLEFSYLGFIGKLFRTADLPALAEFFIMFFGQKPVDWLLPDFLRTRACGLLDDKVCRAAVAKTVIRHKPSLFQHVGRHSSLAGKIQKLADADFSVKKASAAVAGPVDKLKPTNNPPLAYFNLTLKTYEKNTIDKAYAGSGYFWALNPQQGDYIFLKLKQPLNLAKLTIESGNPQHPTDRFYDAVVELLQCDSDVDACNATWQKFFKVAEFSNADGSVVATRASDLPPISALRVRVLKKSAFWVLIRRILIEEHKPKA